MPELPEVETTRLGIEPWIKNSYIESIVVRNPSLRWPISIPDYVLGQKVLSVRRRAKYLLIDLDSGSLIGHLGMSGSLSIVTSNSIIKKHDHLDIVFSDNLTLRYNDPRRFGSWHYHDEDPENHWLLRDLGVEPLSEEFCGEYLHGKSRSKLQAVKSYIMDSKIVVGVGNIYAAEALFLSGIRPTVRASRLSLDSYRNLVTSIKLLLARAIEIGGTTLRDFTSPSGEPGYFQQTLNVYGRNGLPCTKCGAKLKRAIISQRSSIYCRNCQGYRSRSIADIN